MRDQRHFENDQGLIHSPDPQGGVPPDLALDPSVRVLWRSTEQIQLELGARRVIVDGVDQNGVRRLTGQLGEAPDSSLLDDAFDALRAAGFLTRRSRDRATQVPRLAAEFAALRVRHAERADDVLGSRRASTVAINGTGRIAAIIGALLGAAGVGRVSIAGDGDVRLHQTAPGGLLPSDEGRRFTAAAADAVTRMAPDCDTSPAPAGYRPDLVVLAADRRRSTPSCATRCTRGARRTWWPGPVPITAASARWRFPESPAACAAPICTGSTATPRGRRWPFSLPLRHGTATRPTSAWRA